MTAQKNGGRKNAHGNQEQKKQKRRNRLILLVILILVAYFISVAVTAKTTLNIKSLGPRTESQELILARTLDEKYPARNSIALTTSPFAANVDYFQLNAKSAIIIDSTTGEILYEKNADLQIPPASMTKIVEMYIVLDEVEKGLITLDDTVPLPEESWEINIPWDASRMHLAEGQKVTLRELLLGLAIASGNDASIAVANYVCGRAS